MSAEIHNCFDRFFFAFENSFDFSVGQIANPACQV